MSHPTGNANVRAAALGFLKEGMLSEFDTSIATFPGTFLNLLSNFSPFTELNRRRFDPSLKSVTKTFPAREIGRILASKAGFYNLIKHETGFFSVDAVYKKLDNYVSEKLKKLTNPGIDAIYSYEDGAIKSFNCAKKHGIQCLYDLPIGYWRYAKGILEKEKDLWPEWASTITSLKDSEIKLQTKDEELRLADKIFAASKFTAKTLEDFPGTLGPIEVIPYGFPDVTANRVYSNFSLNRPLNLLFVGGLSQRKGIANLFAAVEKLGSRVMLTLVGQKPGETCMVLNEALDKHRWISTLPHGDVLKLMRQHDVLIFPSLFEGFGLVITEAMSQGTPVITTNRTAGPDIINHGENGWIVEAGSTDAITAMIEELLINPHIIAKVGKEAMQTASRRSWDVYGQDLAKSVMKHISGK